MNDEELCRRPGVDPNWWFPEERGAAERAVRLCTGCPVITRCAETAIHRGEKYGIWGGMTPQQRAAERRARAQRVPVGA